MNSECNFDGRKFLNFDDHKLFKCNGGTAFTEDKIEIFNIKVYDITEDMIKHFERFGKIVNVRRLHEDNNAPIHERIKYEIQYEKAESAAGALQALSRSQIKPCHSHEQPYGQRLLAQLNESEYNAQHDPASLLALNDDCLGHIFNFLPLPDQLVFALSCRRLTAVLRSHSKVQHKNFNTVTLNNMTLFQIRILLQIVGPQIKNLTSHIGFLVDKFGSEDEVYAFLETVLVNIKKFKIIDLPSNEIRKLIENMQLLQELELLRSTFDDKFIQILETFKNLRKITIVQNSIITGAGIEKLTGLEQLTLSDCPEILPRFKYICKNLKNLNYLDLRGKNCKFNMLMDTEDYEHIAKYLLQLETLKITCFKGNYNCLASLPNLVRLEINVPKGEEFLAHLAKKQPNKLEELCIKAHDVTPKAATSVAKLKRLKVLNCNFGLNDKIMEGIANLKELENVEFCNTSELTDYGIFKLLENCLKLKRVGLWCLSAEKRDLMFKSHKFIEKQREQGDRAGCVHFVFIESVKDITLTRKRNICLCRHS